MPTVRRRSSPVRRNILARPPFPLRNPKRVGRKPKYQFAGMRVGDSFLQPWERNEPKHIVQGRLICAAIAHLGAGNYTTRSEEDGCRIWRTDKRKREEARRQALLA